MRQPKRRWVAVNYESGTVLQVVKPTTKHKALKILGEHMVNNETYEILENMEQIKQSN